MFEIFDSVPLMHLFVTIGSFIIFAIGLVGALTRKNLIRIFLSLSIAETALFVYFIGMHYGKKSVAPISVDGAPFSVLMVDPVPQAMILTTIVIAIAVLALALSFVIAYYKRSGNLDIDKMDELGDDK